MTPAQFRTDFPEFASSSVYPDSLITLWSSVATQLVNAERWGTLTDIAIELCTAHHIALAARDQAASATGAIPGEMTGPVSAKSVDKVSVAYDTGAAALTNAGFWSLTTYGVRFLQLARMFGAGGIQVPLCQ
jgi:hypothetical protein